MPRLKRNEEYEHRLVPIDLWGKDHWSMLMFLEHCLVDEGGFKIEFEPRMRQNRHHFRVMPRRGKNRSPFFGTSMDPEFGSRLNNGTFILNHDDWCCVQDFAEEGLLSLKTEEIDVDCRKKITLTEKGKKLANQLRNHKSEKKTFRTFKPDLEVEQVA